MLSSGAPPNFALLQVTMLGSCGCGKTSLINAFVNNSCPMIHEKTVDPVLYYKTFQVTLTKDDASQGSDELAEEEVSQPVLLEIEDTFGSEVSNSGAIVDRFGKPRSIESCLDLRRNDLQTHTGAEGAFAPYDAPAEGQQLSERRMGFFIVVDVNDMQSWKEAKRILELFKDGTEECSPVGHLVANKMDRDPEHPHVRRVLQKMEKKSEELAIPLVKVSAFEYKRVRLMFRRMAKHILQEGPLWRPDAMNVRRSTAPPVPTAVSSVWSLWPS